jgi:hypothetical protein
MKCAMLPALLILTCLAAPGLLPAEEMPVPSVIPAEEYALYDQTIESIFLTSYTRLVVIERMTVVRLLPDQKELITIGSFHDRNFFMGRLPSDLVRDFIGANREASRLQGRFQFGVRYRFVTGQSLEEPEVSAAVPVQALQVLERLAFSRVGRTLQNDQALVYVEQMRPDETGAGFLVWFHRKEREWMIYDTEVIWTIRSGAGPEAP